MKKNKKKYSPFQMASAIFMILALLWLTISAPFILSGQQKSVKQQKTSSTSVPAETSEEESSNPLGNNTTEEKVPGTISLSEEYLHDHHTTEYFFSLISQYHKLENAGTYTAFHGEILIPPPNAA